MIMQFKKDGVALLAVIFIMIIFSIFGMMLASIFANRTEIAKGFYRITQTTFINDMGVERSKQKLHEDWSFRTAGLQEQVTIASLSGLYTIVITEAAGSSVEIYVESKVSD